MTMPISIPGANNHRLVHVNAPIEQHDAHRLLELRTDLHTEARKAAKTLDGLDQRDLNKHPLAFGTIRLSASRRAGDTEEVRKAIRVVLADLGEPSESDDPTCPYVICARALTRVLELSERIADIEAAHARASVHRRAANMGSDTAVTD
ncbi:MAG: hypothetical protein AAFU69_14255 [Pseudomonadota bacterium]